ncbi:MAG: biopolymer transporter ExbD [Bacteroidales bacterium]|jgi:biopolymer transport protein ExbD|nr:biopolymer transporter ExbD [Bacteroidales bacterium]
MARKLAEVNASSVADIAFLLLIFFLVATTMDVDSGLYRKLSPTSDQPPPEIKERNVLVVLVNSNDQLMVEGEEVQLSSLRSKAKDFLQNKHNKENLPEKRIDNVDPFGNIEVTKGIISLKNDRATSYEMFISVMNELIAAGNEVKDEFSMDHFGKKYKELPNHLQQAVKQAVPAVISESEPMHIGG